MMQKLLKSIYVKFIFVICIALVVSSCTSSKKSQDQISTNIESTIETPSQKFVSALEANIVALQLYWDDSELAVNQGINKFVSSVQVESDNEYSVVTITAQAETNSDELAKGKSIFFDKDLNLKMFCTGNTWTSFYNSVFNEILGSAFTFGPRNMSILELPSTGVVIKMVWNQVTTSTDEFGSEITSKKLIGTDQLGISTSNLEKVTDPMGADYRKLSDLVTAKYAKQSWHDGRCAREQTNYNY